MTNLDLGRQHGMPHSLANATRLDLATTMNIFAQSQSRTYWDTVNEAKQFAAWTEASWAQMAQALRRIPEEHQFQTVHQKISAYSSSVPLTAVL
jgi:hypothetical protein